jgi:hypothetical protein
MAGKNTLILASDFNALQSSAALVLGQGSGTYGYGQSEFRYLNGKIYEMIC